MTTEKQPVFYSIESPWIEYYTSGTITADYAATVELPNGLTVSSFYDQSKGICIKTTSNRVTVQGIPQSSCDYYHYYYYCWRYNYNMRHSETFAVIPVTGLCSSEYEYYAISVNSSSSYYKSSVLVVGTEDNTMIKLTVTQSVKIIADNVVIKLIPYKEYSFTINRLQTAYIGSPDDLTGSKIVTNKEVSVFSGHQYGYLLNSLSSFLMKQIPPTVLWGKVHYVMPLKDVPAGYAIKVVASTQCVIKIHCNSFSSNFSLNDQGSMVKKFVNNESCTIQSNSSVLVAQFSLGIHFTIDLLMILVPSTKQYCDRFIFYNNIDPIRVYSYVNIIVMAEYYHPKKIYLTADGYNISLGTKPYVWVPIKNNNITAAFATQVNVTNGVVKIFHANKTALMTIITYGFSNRGSYGTAIYGHINKGIISIISCVFNKIKCMHHYNLSGTVI